MKFALFLGLAGVCGSVASAQKVNIMFEGEGTRVLWIAAKPGAPPANAISTNEKEIDFDFGGAKDSDHIYILNKATNNISTEMVEAILQEKAWAVSSSSETLIGEVRVQLQHGGEPLAAGSITAIYGKERRELMLTPSANGTVSVFGILPGTFKVVPKVPVNGSPKAYPAQSWDLTLVRTQPIPILTVVIPDEVETVAAATPPKTPGTAKKVPAAPGQKSADKTTEAKSGSRTEEPLVPPSDPMPAAEPRGFPFLSTFFALAVLVGLGFLVRYLMTNKSDQVAAGLKKLGVPVPDDVAAVDDLPPPAPRAPEPIPQILLDSADPDPVSQVPSPIVLGVAALSRLVDQSGQVFAIAEGEAIIGRDAACDLALVGQDSVSRQHAKITRRGDEVTVEDLGSTNGTFVSGKKVNPGEVVSLAPGQTLQLGTTMLRGE
ncbi:MAG: FHA domain-containing protein [Chthonomonas sp.]|nr:FHA domain-containing protein [Chthonomonas sp.]